MTCARSYVFVSPGLSNGVLVSVPCTARTHFVGSCATVGCTQMRQLRGMREQQLWDSSLSHFLNRAAHGTKLINVGTQHGRRNPPTQRTTLSV